MSEEPHLHDAQEHLERVREAEEARKRLGSVFEAWSQSIKDKRESRRAEIEQMLEEDDLRKALEAEQRSRVRVKVNIEE